MTDFLKLLDDEIERAADALKAANEKWDKSCADLSETDRQRYVVRNSYKLAEMAGATKALLALKEKATKRFSNKTNYYTMTKREAKTLKGAK